MSASLAAHAPSPFPSDAEIKQILIERIDRQQQGVGMVIGTFGPAGRRIVSRGRFGTFHTRPVDGDTVFEIGSITKVFTALLLAEMAGRGEVSLNDPVAKYLPESVKVPTRAGRQITLTDLATHTPACHACPATWHRPTRRTPMQTIRSSNSMTSCRLTSCRVT